MNEVRDNTQHLNLERWRNMVHSSVRVRLSSIMEHVPSYVRKKEEQACRLQSSRAKGLDEAQMAEIAAVQFFLHSADSRTLFMESQHPCMLECIPTSRSLKVVLTRAKRTLGSGEDGITLMLRNLLYEGKEEMLPLFNHMWRSEELPHCPS